MKQLVFDVSDAQTITDSDSVGAFLRAGIDGALIGSQDLDSQNWINTASILHDKDGNLIDEANPLHVEVTNDIAVDLDGIYSSPDNEDPDSAGIIAHTRTATPGISDQTFRSTGGAASSDAVVASDVHGLDANAFGMVFNGTTWDRMKGTDGKVDVHGDDFDIRDLTHVSDSIRLGDGTDLTTTTTVGGDVGLDVYSINDPALANTAIANAANVLSVADTAEETVETPLAGRKYLWIRNQSNQEIYIGGSSVSEANGFPVPSRGMADLRAGASVDVYFVGRSGATPEIRTLELA